MKLYFCETCGRRITDKEIASGEARDKKLKGVFCGECAVGVLTIEMMPITEEQARNVLRVKRESPQQTIYAKNQPLCRKRTRNSCVVMYRLRSPVFYGLTAGALIASVFLFVGHLLGPRQGRTQCDPSSSTTPSHNTVEKTTANENSHSRSIACSVEPEHASKNRTLHKTTKFQINAEDMQTHPISAIQAEQPSRPVLTNGVDSKCSSLAPELHEQKAMALPQCAPMDEHTITLQQGQPIKWASLGEYNGTQTGHVYGYADIAKRVQPCTTHMSVGNCRLMLGLINFAVFAFEGGPLPDQVEILDARLHVYRLGPNTVASLRRIVKPWKPEKVTFNNLAAEENFFATHACLKGGPGTKIDGWYEFDCTRVLKEAQKSGENYGWAIDAANSLGQKSWTATYFASSKYDKDPSLRPKLVLKIKCLRLP